MLKVIFDRVAAACGKPNVAAAINVARPNSTTQVVSVMTEEHEERDTLGEEEVEAQDGEPLPERTQMSLINPPGGPIIGPPHFIEPVDGSET